jgi:hypothetical protein
MVMTVLKAHVARDRIAELERVYREGTAALPPDIVETFLVGDSRDETLFHIVTVWVSREALENMRASVEKPKGVQMFEAAGATPELSILDVVVHRRNQANRGQA